MGDVPELAEEELGVEVIHVGGLAAEVAEADRGVADHSREIVPAGRSSDVLGESLCSRLRARAR